MALCVVMLFPFHFSRATRGGARAALEADALPVPLSLSRSQRTAALR